jgi:hypothetical protein
MVSRPSIQFLRRWTARIVEILVAQAGLITFRFYGKSAVKRGIILVYYQNLISGVAYTNTS